MKLDAFARKHAGLECALTCAGLAAVQHAAICTLVVSLGVNVGEDGWMAKNLLRVGHLPTPSLLAASTFNVRTRDQVPEVML